MEERGHGIYGYLNRVRSNRRQLECHRNIELIWLPRTLKPDFRTIADSLRNHFARAVPIALVCPRIFIASARW